MLTHAEIEASTKNGRRDPDTHNACKVVALGLLVVAYRGYLHGMMMILGPDAPFHLVTAIVVPGALDKGHSLRQTCVCMPNDCLNSPSQLRACVLASCNS